MTTTGEFTTSPVPQPTGQPGRLLRRSRTDRVGAGVAGGLGAYFGIDPVLFRVLFATSAFFGGAGILAYLLAWAAIPEEGTEYAAIDRWVRELRRRKVPLWIVAVVGALLLWGVAFSWWAPGPFFPVMIVVIVLVAVFARRGTPNRQPAGWWPAAPSVAPGEPGTPGDADASAATVDLTKAPAAAAASAPSGESGPSVPPVPPVWASEGRQWLSEARQASRERRRRAFPVRMTAIVTLVVTLGILAAVDAGAGIVLPVYFWVTFGIVALALLVGMVLRRTPWSLTTLLLLSLLGIIGFGATDASLHDGFGQRDWIPTTSPSDEYRLAFGQGVLDLRHLPPQSGPRTIDVTMAAGQVRVLLPHGMNATVNANVHLGAVAVDGAVVDQTGAMWHNTGGVNLRRVILPPSGATGQPLTIDVHLADGQISIEHR